MLDTEAASAGPLPRQDLIDPKSLETRHVVLNRRAVRLSLPLRSHAGEEVGLLRVEFLLGEDSCVAQLA